ncbi:MAG TPA: CZB domain-containing protein [Gammaproteobacteria bacterium]|nr:CZB domain-containing protein [Gammaproteobacteria bacterium]
MDLGHAIESHINWRTKFRKAITNHEAMDVATISRDNCCELGQWLHGDGKVKYGKLKSYEDCVRKHAAFHVEAGKVAKAINDKKFKEAEAMLNAGTSYTSTSNAVCVAISVIKEEAGI